MKASLQPIPLGISICCPCIWCDRPNQGSRPPLVQRLAFPLDRHWRAMQRRASKTSQIPDKLENTRDEMRCRCHRSVRAYSVILFYDAWCPLTHSLTRSFIHSFIHSCVLCRQWCCLIATISFIFGGDFQADLTVIPPICNLVSPGPWFPSLTTWPPICSLRFFVLGWLCHQLTIYVWTRQSELEEWRVPDSADDMKMD